jgi:pimeloyl-[acyl-carrier protein] methyl ester esterase
MKGGHCGPQALRAAQKLQADWPAYTSGVVRRILATGKQDDALMVQLRAIALGCDASSLARLWVDMVCQDFRAYLSNFAAPSLVAYGAKSQLYPLETAAWLGATLPHAEVQAFQHSGHAPHLEETQAFNQTLDAFAANLAAIHQDTLGGLSCQ